MVLATVPAAPPALKNRRATSWPAPISANVPKTRIQVDLQRFLSRPDGMIFHGRALSRIAAALRLHWKQEF